MAQSLTRDKSYFKQPTVFSDVDDTTKIACLVKCYAVDISETRATSYSQQFKHEDRQGSTICTLDIDTAVL